MRITIVTISASLSIFLGGMAIPANAQGPASTRRSQIHRSRPSYGGSRGYSGQRGSYSRGYSYRGYGYRGYRGYGGYGYYRPSYYRSYYSPYYYSPYYYGSYYRPYGSLYFGWPSFGFGLSLGHRPYYSAPYYYAAPGPVYGGGYGYSYGGAQAYASWRGAVRIKASPKEAEVYVDGFYAGVVDDYDGSFQRLYLDPGPHEIVIRLEGYRVHRQKLHLQGGNTANLVQELVPLGAGETTPPPPQPAEPPEAPRSSVSSLPPEAREPGSEPAPYDRRPSETTEARPTPEPRRTISQAPPPPLSPSSFGELVLRVQPGDAEIWIDGQLWGTMDGFDRLPIHLVAGLHTVTIRRPGYDNFSSEIEVGSGLSTPLNVRLTEAPENRQPSAPPRRLNISR